MKAFFEDPAQLVGFPLLAIGVLGIAVAAAALLFARPMQTTAQGPTAPPVRQGVLHPAFEDFIGVIAIIGGLTVVEFLLFAFGIQYTVFVGILFGMTVVKFALVVMFLLHLKYDSSMFTNAFLGTFAVAAAAAVMIVSVIVGNVV